MAEDLNKVDVQETETTEEVSTDTKEDVKDTPTESPDADDAEELRKEIKKLRKESAKYRTKGNELEEQFNSFKDSIAKSLGLKEDDNPDNDKLSDELTQLQGKYRQERLKNAFYRVAEQYSADTDLTWAKLYAEGQLTDIDVDGEDFEDSLNELVKTAVANNPKLKNNYKQDTSANPPGDQKKTAKDEYNEVLAEVRKNPNDQSLKQKLFILKSRLKE